MKNLRQTRLVYFHILYFQNFLRSFIFSSIALKCVLCTVDVIISPHDILTSKFIHFVQK